MAIRRPMEAGAMTLVTLAILFLPLLLGLQRLYPWARSGVVERAIATYPKSMYLNVPFFIGRAAFYFVISTRGAGAEPLLAQARQFPNPAPSLWLQALSGPGLVVLFVTGTFAAIDWGMSLEPQWASTIYGAMLITGDALCTLALFTIVVVELSADEPMRKTATSSRLHDVGNLTLAFVMLWAYMSFSQFLIIWSGNLSEETPLVRSQDARRLAVGRLASDRRPFLPAFLRLALSGDQGTCPAAGSRGLDHTRHASRRPGLAGRPGRGGINGPARFSGVTSP